MSRPTKAERDVWRKELLKRKKGELNEDQFKRLARKLHIIQRWERKMGGDPDQTGTYNVPLAGKKKLRTKVETCPCCQRPATIVFR